MRNLKSFFANNPSLKGITILFNEDTGAFHLKMMRRVKSGDAKSIATFFVQKVNYARVRLETHNSRQYWLAIEWVCSSFTDVMSSMRYMSDILKVCYREHKIQVMKQEVQMIEKFMPSTRLVPQETAQHCAWMEDTYPEDLPF